VTVALVHLDVAERSERVIDSIRATPANTKDDIRDMQEDEAMTRRALDLLGFRRNDRYEAALAALREDTRTWWSETLAEDPDQLEDDGEPFTADSEACSVSWRRRSCPGSIDGRGNSSTASDPESRRSAKPLTPTDWSGSAAARSTSTASNKMLAMLKDLRQGTIED
jgi:hypothetical protein